MKISMNVLLDGTDVTPIRDVSTRMGDMIAGVHGGSGPGDLDSHA